MWHVSSRSGVATLRTAIHLLLTYLLTYSLQTDAFAHQRHALVAVHATVGLDVPRERGEDKCPVGVTVSMADPVRGVHFCCGE